MCRGIWHCAGFFLPLMAAIQVLNKVNVYIAAVRTLRQALKEVSDSRDGAAELLDTFDLYCEDKDDTAHILKLLHEYDKQLSEFLIPSLLQATCSLRYVHPRQLPSALVALAPTLVNNGPVLLAPSIPFVPADAATALLADLFTPPPDLRLAAIQRAAVGVAEETDPSWCPVLASFAAVDDNIIPLLDDIGKHASAPGVVVNLIAALRMLLADARPRENCLQRWVDIIVFKIGCAVYAQRYLFQSQNDSTFVEAFIRRHWTHGNNGKTFERSKNLQKEQKAAVIEDLRRDAQRVASQHARVLDAYREHGAIVFLDPNWCFKKLEENRVQGARAQDNTLADAAVARHTAAEAAILNIVGAYCNSNKHRYIDQVCGLLWELRRSYAVLSGLGVQ
ncbi:hypothetical protein R3P38DRAFT_3144188 [Favolaschia claudopus]|uniref:Uncharacterized protein n=1 Tax=Favolaschia claudopus TaxID=2862362 RepID=A0AAV9Z461_9AGAR